MARCRNFIISGVLVSEFDYFLPDELIAQEPLADRAASRLLHLNRNMPDLADRQFRDFPDLLRPDDLVVFNNTRVFPARLFGHRSGAQGATYQSSEPSLARVSARDHRGSTRHGKFRKNPTNGNVWSVLDGKSGWENSCFSGQNQLRSELASRSGRSRKASENAASASTLRQIFWAVVERIGHVPLPPYIVRQDQPVDRERYQTVYAQEKGR